VYPVRTWIRTEYLATDFRNAFSPFLDLSSIDLSREFSKKSNVTDYNKELSQWFSSADLKLLYASCPLWAQLEASLYGDLISLYPHRGTFLHWFFYAAYRLAAPPPAT